MKRIGVLLAAIVLVQFANAAPDIGYSNDENGHWSYTASQTSGEGVFSFVQPIGIDDVQGAATDALVNGFLYIPDLYVGSLVEVAPGTGIYQGSITPVSSTIAIKDISGSDVLVGSLETGGLVTVGTTASMYPVFSIDITVTGLPNAIGSDYVGTLSVNDVFDFDLTLQGAEIAAMILNNLDNAAGSTLSGTMTYIVPEPATLILLGLGGMMLRKRK